ncbi:MAG: hypothetical protein ABIQ30_10485 [Devosia sp.]
MSWVSAFTKFVRGIFIVLATSAAAFGALVVFHPLDQIAPQKITIASNGVEAKALEGRIEALRLAVRAAEISQMPVDAQIVTGSVDTASRAQFEAQIAAASERRDLALRHAKTIRDALGAGIPVSSFAEIRDSVVIGQLLSQQGALNAQVSIEGARLRPNHPTMRALTAQSTSLSAQIRQEAASIASALEAEARLDDAQVTLLQSQLPAEAMPPVARVASAPDAALAAQRAELDDLVDKYFNIPPATAPIATTSSSHEIFSAINIGLVVVAALAAIGLQLGLAVRRRKKAQTANIKAWRDDSDREVKTATTPAATETPRKAA